MATSASTFNKPSVRVLLADDSDVMREAIRRLLAERPEVDLVGEASDFNETIQMANKLQPRVIVMDLHMPRAECPDVRSRLNGGAQLVAISISNDQEAMDLAESFGAVVLLDKMNLYNELVPAIMKLTLADATTAD